jgi:alkylation response protein AidB-like acyl-CoA dehydrogenase
MDLTLTREQEEVRAAARRFLEAECTPARARAMAEEPDGFSRRMWRELAELGWHGLALSEYDGGIGGSFFELGLLIEELGRAALPSPFVTSTVLGARAIATFGSVPQRREVLPSLISGERIASVASGGWGADEPGVEAREAGDGFVLDGALALVPYAGAADLLVVVARDQDHASAFLVPREAISLRPVEVLGGDARCDVSFAETHVARQALLGERRRGGVVAEALALWGAAARSAELVGLGQRVLDMTVAYAGERTAFGRPIGALQAIQHHLADMAVDLLGARLISY